jgi:hypothetical protein
LHSCYVAQALAFRAWAAPSLDVSRLSDPAFIWPPTGTQRATWKGTEICFVLQEAIQQIGANAPRPLFLRDRFGNVWLE